MSKHPELRAARLAEGVTIPTAYARLERGWSLERAISTPPRINKVKLVPRVDPTVPWERLGYKRTAKPRMVRTRIIPEPNDTSPPHIRKLRARFCDHFIKTGEIDQSMQTKLREYADECRTASQHPAGVPAEHAPRHRARSGQYAGNDGGRDVHQIDGAAAGRIREFLRM